MVKVSFLPDAGRFVDESKEKIGESVDYWSATLSDYRMASYDYSQN